VKYFFENRLIILVKLRRTKNCVPIFGPPCITPTYLCAGALTYLLTYTVFGSVRIKPSISPKQLKIE